MKVFIQSYTMYLSTRFYENKPNEISNYLSEKGSKGRFFFLLISSKITPIKGKGALNTLRLTEEVYFRNLARYIFLLFSQTNWF